MTPCNKIDWTAELDAFLIENFNCMTNAEIAKGVGISLCSTRSRLISLGYKRIELEYWTENQVETLKAHYQTKGDKELAEWYNEIYPKKKGWTLKHIEKKRNYLNLHRTKEQLAAIKERSRLKGAYSINHWKRWIDQAPLGDIKVWYPNSNPVKYIKTKNGYQRLAHFNWIKANGQIPKGYVIRIKNGDPMNCEIANLECITKAQNGMKNSAAINLSDGWVLHCIANRQPELQKELLKYPELIQLARTNYLLKKEIKNGSKSN